MGYDDKRTGASTDAHDLLTAADRAVIEAAADADWYRTAPVSEALRAQFSPDFLSFVFIPSQARQRLTQLFGTASNTFALIAADWACAFAAGALYLHDECSVSFATHVPLANGHAVEVSIAKSKRPDGLPWYLSYVPQVERLRLRRDVAQQGGCYYDFSCCLDNGLVICVGCGTCHVNGYACGRLGSRRYGFRHGCRRSGC